MKSNQGDKWETRGRFSCLLFLDIDFKICYCKRQSGDGYLIDDHQRQSGDRQSENRPLIIREPSPDYLF